MVAVPGDQMLYRPTTVQIRHSRSDLLGQLGISSPPSLLFFTERYRGVDLIGQSWQILLTNGELLVFRCRFATTLHGKWGNGQPPADHGQLLHVPIWTVGRTSSNTATLIFSIVQLKSFFYLYIKYSQAKTQRD